MVYNPSRPHMFLTQGVGVDSIVHLANPGFRIYLPISRAPRATHFDRRNLNFVGRHSIGLRGGGFAFVPLPQWVSQETEAPMATGVRRGVVRGDCGERDGAGSALFQRSASEIIYLPPRNRPALCNLGLEAVWYFICNLSRVSTIA